MQFKFEILTPSEKAIKIIETYEDIGYTVCLQISENAQWNDDTDYIGFSTIIKGKYDDSMFFTLPKTEFEEKATYYDWMPREEFEKLCEQDERYRWKACILSCIKVTPNISLSNLAVGCVDYHGGWCSTSGGSLFAVPFKFVKLV